MQSPAGKAMTPIEWGLLIVLSILWGGSFFFVEVALDGLPPFTLVLGRVALAALALHAVVLAGGQRMPSAPGIWLAFLVMGGLNNLLPFSLIVWGQTQITSGLAAILNATTPLWTVVLAHLLTRDERLTPGRLAGVLLGLLGVVVLNGPAALAGLGVHLLAQLAVLAAAASYACAGLYGRRFRGTSPLVTATGQLTATTVMMLPLALVVDRPWALPMPSPTALGALAGLALLSTAVAYVLYFRILARAGATNVLLVTFLVPVSALLLGTAILGEPFRAQQALGMGLIGLGLAAIDGRPAARLRRAAGAAGG